MNIGGFGFSFLLWFSRESRTHRTEKQKCFKGRDGVDRRLENKDKKLLFSLWLDPGQCSFCLSH